MFAGPVGASSDRGASTMLRKEPLSLRLEREGRQGFSRLFCTTLPRPLVCELKSLGLGNVLQEESLSLCTEQEGRQGFS